MIFAPLFGYLGDRCNRKWVMVIGITIWSVATLLGSFMEEYYSFLAMRAIVGIGEASYTTIAPTILSDMFVKFYDPITLTATFPGILESLQGSDSNIEIVQSSML